jgi:hypothetical protein
MNGHKVNKKKKSGWSRQGAPLAAVPEDEIHASRRANKELATTKELKDQFHRVGPGF